MDEILLAGFDLFVPRKVNGISFFFSSEGNRLQTEKKIIFRSQKYFLSYSGLLLLVIARGAKPFLGTSFEWGLSQFGVYWIQLGTFILFYLSFLDNVAHDDVIG